MVYLLEVCDDERGVWGLVDCFSEPAVGGALSSFCLFCHDHYFLILLQYTMSPLYKSAIEIQMHYYYA